jgi:tetratricopeptide (TPR) repeat protein
MLGALDRIDMLKGFIANNPKDPFPRYGLALELKNRGRLVEAADEFQTLMEQFPDYTAAYLHAGNVARERGERPNAGEIYRRGIGICQQRGDGHALGELEGALASLENEGGED